MGKGYILVEGHGELGAVDNLISRLSEDLGLRRVWAPAIRWKNLHLARGVEHAPSIAEWVRGLRLPFPSAVVLLRPEYEVLFLPCLDQMAGKPLGTGASARPGLRPGTRWEGSWESRRGVKEWLSDHFPPNRIYKPTLDQLPLTRLIDFNVLREADLPCFGTLERALKFLAEGLAGGVYPPANLE